MRRGVAAALAAAALVVVGACGEDPNSIAAQAKSGSRKGYISGDGSVEKVAIDQRQRPVSLSGTTVDGIRLSLADYRSSVVVVNVWGSWCGPCEAEAPELKKAWSSLSGPGKPVQFLKYGFEEWKGKGLDQHSVIADPKFADAAKGDLALAADSPARKLGFKPIDLSGVPR